MLTLHAVSKSYPTPQGALAVLDGLDAAWGPGTYALMGASGSGKSTLLNLIAGLDTPTAGEIRFEGTALASYTAAQMDAYRARTIGLLFQEHHLLGHLTALDNVLLATVAVNMPQPHAVALALLAELGIDQRMAFAYPHQLSGGQCQRVALARALINQPRMLLCDEPTGSLDAATARQVAGTIIEIAQRRGLIVLVVTHNPDLAALMQQRYHLADGHLTRQT
ncbi:MAG: ABC transporter ATP-binding protein [Phycisphaerae bacterium]